MTEPMTAAGRRARGLDRLLTAGVVLFAFLAASFAARNSDAWRDLAVGRLVAAGGYSFGSDPLSTAGRHEHWVNPSWLYQLGLYGTYAAGGGTGVVLLKALAVALAALLLARAGGPGWAGPACAALAVLAASPRLLVQPAVGSFALLACFVWLLHRPRSPARHGLLVVGCALWANVDAWCALGPAVVTLWWLGRRVWPGRDPDTVLPGWVPLACWGAALVNPHGLLAWGVPPDLAVGEWADVLRASHAARPEPRLASLFASPWDVRRYLWAPDGSASLAGWAYFVLLALGPASFALNRRRPDPARALVWLAFALLGAWNVRTVPLFAVAAAPLTARNLSEAFAGLALSASARRAGVAARVVPLAAVGVLAWLAAAGWLQGFPDDAPRRASWAMRSDPTWRAAAEAVRDHYEAGRLDGQFDIGFCVDPDAAHHVAWFAPGVRTFMDGRYWLYNRQVLAEAAELARGLSPGGRGEGRGMMRYYGLTWVLAPRPRLEGADDLILLGVDGQCGLFGWAPVRRPSDKPPFPRLALVPGRLAYGPGEGLASVAAVPGSPPDRAEAPWWGRLVGADCTGTGPGGAAAAYLTLFEGGPADAKRRHDAEWSARLAAAVGEESGAGALGALLLRTPAAADPAAALLAVRSARAGLAACPDDARGSLALGRAYLALGRLTGEPTEALSPLGTLRHVQAANALEAAARLAPDAEPTRRALAELYEDRGYLDAALPHLLAAARLARRAGPAAGESADAFAARVDALDARARELERSVQDARQLLAVHSAGLTDKPLDRADEALRLGLAREALEGVLLKSQVLLFGHEGAKLQLRLLLELGRADDAGRMLDSPELTEGGDALGLVGLPAPGRPGLASVSRYPARPWLAALRAAAAGDYDTAVARLRGMADGMAGESDVVREKLGRAVRLAVAAEVAGGAAAEALAWHAQAADHRGRLSGMLALGESLRPQRAELLLLAGLLELERGRPDEADALLAQAAGEDAPPPARALATAYRGRIAAAREPRPEPPSRPAGGPPGRRGA